MKLSSLTCFRSPASRTRLQVKIVTSGNDEELIDGELESESGEIYSVRGGIADFTHPSDLLQSDAEVISKYDNKSNFYDIGLNWLFESFYEDEGSIRTKMLDALNIREDSRVLETGAGTGRDSVLIAKRLSAAGELQVQDLSRGMLLLCREKLGETIAPKVEYSIANASYLPFCDQYFDCAYHFGGINTFAEKKRAVHEMARVTKVGGRVLFGDESVPPWLRDSEFGKILINANPLYEHVLPLECLPECARNVNISWVIGGVFYVISFDVGQGAPRVDLDLPIPGKGDSLRSRYNTALRRQREPNPMSTNS